jgi:hypothetical protein
MTNTSQTTNPSSDLRTMFNQLETLFEEYLGKKAPALPTNAKEMIVKYSPYISLVIIFFSLPAILFALGLGALLTPFAFMGGVRYGFSFSFSTLFLLATLILQIAAIPGLFARQLAGWKKIYFATLLSAVYSLLNFQLGNMIIGTVISLYFLFQVKSYYKK